MLYTRAKSITSQTYTPLSQTRPPYSTQHSLPKKVYHPNSHPLTRSVHRTQPTTHMNKETQPSQTTSIAFSRLRSQSYQRVFCQTDGEYNKFFKVNRMSTLVCSVRWPIYAARVDQMYLRYVKSLLSLRHAHLF